MKKFMILGAAASLLLVAGAACSNQNGKAPVTGKSEKQVYTGVLPAADTDGIRYTLTLDYDEDDNNMKGDFDLVQTYIQTDTVNASGVKDLLSVRSEGDFFVENKNGNTYLRFATDAKDSDRNADTAPMYFVVESDSTMVLVNNELQMPETPALYTLKRTNR